MTPLKTHNLLFFLLQNSYLQRDVISNSRWLRYSYNNKTFPLHNCSSCTKHIFIFIYIYICKSWNICIFKIFTWSPAMNISHKSKRESELVVMLFGLNAPIIISVSLLHTNEFYREQNERLYENKATMKHNILVKFLLVSVAKSWPKGSSWWTSESDSTLWQLLSVNHPPHLPDLSQTQNKQNSS